MRPAPLVFVLVLATLSCATEAPHIAPYVVRHREYAAPAGTTTESATPGSLFRDGRLGAALFTDPRAHRVDDLVEVRVEETADARRTADTDLTRSSKTALELSAFVHAANATGQQGFDGSLSGGHDGQFRGDGVTSRTDRLTATVPAIVRQVLPNGNLFIEGHRVVLVNREEHHFYISGVVRPIDIDMQNGVRSSLIADAEIEFTGVGVLSEVQEQGWLAKHLGWLWPF